MEPLEGARELFSEFEAQLRGEMPVGADVFDAHTHLGNDIDGMAGQYEELEAMLDRYGISRCNVFCLDEPDRHPGFRAGNDRTLAFAERSQGRMIPYVRLDLSEEPIAEAERCLDRGARGIKLHPRAQKFLLDDERLAPVFAIAAERRVPILIHGGRGLPPIADNLYRLVHAYPEALLIIRQQDSFGALGLALNATEETNGRAGDLAQIRELLLAARDLWRTLPEAEDETAARSVARTTSRLIHLADILALTSNA